MATLIGKTIGKYQILERLGRGGMAEVYKAYHPQLDRYAAIKVMHAFLAEGDNFLIRFQREAKAVAALHHPNIVQVFDFDIEDEMVYMVMEYLDAGTLKEYLTGKAQSLDYAEIIRITTQTASALSYAHTHGVLHRDIKPSNILLSRDGRIVLTDFGIARILSETQFTATGSLVGTPAYMSPEQGMGMSLSPASDLYSLGIILYEMITGKIPFESDTPLAIIHQHINTPLPGILNYRVDVPVDLISIVEKLLKKNPEERYRSAEELIFDLQAVRIDIKTAPQKSGPGFSAENNLEKEALETGFDTETVVDTGLELPEQEDPTPDLMERPTVAMKKTPPESKIETETTPLKPKAALMEETAEDMLVRIKVSEQKQPAWKKWGLIGLAVLVLAVLIFGGISLLSGGQNQAACETIDRCHLLAEEKMGQQNPEEAINYIDKAISLVPDGENLPHAELWCFRGDILLAMDQPDEAMGSYQTCFDWTEGDPGLEELRVFAMDHMDMIRREE